MATELLNELTRRGVVLVVTGDRLRFYPRTAMTPELVGRLREHKAEVLEILSEPWPEVDGDAPDPCPQCGSLELWETMSGRWRCMKCDPPERAIRLLEKVERIRWRCGLPDPPGAAELFSEIST